MLTLIVVAMLTLGAAAFFERMFAEHQAERAHGRQLQANNLAESGVEYAKAVLMQDPTTTQQAGGLFSNPNLFQAVLVNDDPLAAFRGRFTILSPDLTTDGYFGGTRYGLESESGRLNLNTILLADQSGQNGGRTLLMTLPGMTEQIADAILDWIDPDDNPREQGAERDYYAALPHPYAPRNGPLASIDELLLVRGVTPALLYGADLNRNYAIDGNEQNLTTIDNADNSNGDLNRGWAAYLTLDSAEANIRVRWHAENRREHGRSQRAAAAAVASFHTRRDEFHHRLSPGRSVHGQRRWREGHLVCASRHEAEGQRTTQHGARFDWSQNSDREVGTGR